MEQRHEDSGLRAVLPFGPMNNKRDESGDVSSHCSDNGLLTESVMNRIAR